MKPGLDCRTKVKMLLLQRGMTQVDLAKAIGLSYSYLNNVVTGKFAINAAQRKIEQYFGVRIWVGLPTRKLVHGKRREIKPPVTIP